MKTKYLLSFVLALWASALSAQAHWNFDFREFQYDMTVYCTLQQGDLAIADTENYEVAAFVGDECRGIVEFVTETGTNNTTLSYGYLRVYSNMSSGEVVTFKCYDKATLEEVNIVTANAVNFESAAALGLPSTPLGLKLEREAPILQGDVDSDVRITINDAVLTINATFGGTPTGFNRLAADVDGDGRITINDAILIINKTF